MAMDSGGGRGSCVSPTSIDAAAASAAAPVVDAIVVAVATVVGGVAAVTVPIISVVVVVVIGVTASPGARCASVSGLICRANGARSRSRWRTLTAASAAWRCRIRCKLGGTEGPASTSVLAAYDEGGPGCECDGM